MDVFFEYRTAANGETEVGVTPLTEDGCDLLEEAGVEATGQNQKVSCDLEDAKILKTECKEWGLSWGQFGTD